MDTIIFALGTNGKYDKEYNVVEKNNTDNNTYEKYYFEDGKLAGVILIGDTSRMVELNDAVMSGKKYEEMFA